MAYQSGSLDVTQDQEIMGSASVAAEPAVPQPIALTSSYLLLKRALDVAVSAGFLVLIGLWLFPLLALLIRLDSSGPALLRQRRLGKNGRSFRMYKFRTMVPDAEQRLDALLDSNPELRAEWNRNFKLQCDPRVTRLGRFLRRTCLDELPQFLNVLRGEMSLVGPRPILEAELGLYGPCVRLYIKTKPGITGLWQIFRNRDAGYAGRVELDLRYLRHVSLWNDISILLRTPGAVLRNGD